MFLAQIERSDSRRASFKVTLLAWGNACRHAFLLFIGGNEMDIFIQEQFHHVVAVFPIHQNVE